MLNVIFDPCWVEWASTCFRGRCPRLLNSSPSATANCFEASYVRKGATCVKPSVEAYDRC